MIWEWIRFAAAALFIVSGLFIEICSVFGVFRLKYILNRMHAAAMGDTLGIALILIGLIIVRGFGFDSFAINILRSVLYYLRFDVMSEYISIMDY